MAGCVLAEPMLKGGGWKGKNRHGREREGIRAREREEERKERTNTRDKKITMYTKNKKRK